MNSKYLILAFAASIATTGCDGFNNKVNFSSLSDVSDSSKAEIDGKPYCEVDFADYTLDTNLIAFELTDNSNVGFGFNLASGFLKAFGLKLQMAKGEMTSAMHLRDTLRPLDTLVDATGTGEFKSTGVDFNLDLGQLGGNFGYYKKTPLSEITDKTVQNNLGNLRTQLNKIETPWSTRAIHLYPEQDQLIVPVGTVAGLRIGDKFSVYNVDYLWKGQPCTSELMFEKKRSVAPIAVLEVTQLEKNAALMTVTERNSDEAIEAGAKVEVNTLPLLKGEKSRALARAVRLGTFSSPKLQIEGGADVDVTPYISEQTRAALTNYGFYPRK